MSKPRVRGSRLTRFATVMMLVLGFVSILVNTTLAAIIIALAVAMFLFEWLLVGRARKSEKGAG